WDGRKMQFTNVSMNDQLKTLSRDRFEIINGDPKFSKEYVTSPALTAIEEWIRHNYREGWEQL
ncbi:MAG TPA: gfo/Idh/MocA family oxidoreductase, partial [Prolixibacteraceae bacterium]|nr:gfo/Idh/MocA family oxidoreductase [Prolixibacteraceae bacterium]